MSKRKPKQVHNRGANGRFIPVGRKGLIVHGKEPAPKRRDRSLGERLVGLRDEGRRWNSVLGKRIEEVDAKVLKLWTSRQIDGAELAEWRRTTNNLVDQLDTGLHRIEEKVAGLLTRTSAIETASASKEWSDWRADTSKRLTVYVEDMKELQSQADAQADRISQLDNLRSVDDTRLREVEKKLQTLSELWAKRPEDLPPRLYSADPEPRDEASVWWKAFWGSWDPKDRPLSSAISIATNMVDELRRLGKIS